jgi:hypothetical protein
MDDKNSGYTWARIYIDALENLDLRGCALGKGHLKSIATNDCSIPACTSFTSTSRKTYPMHAVQSGHERKPMNSSLARGVCFEGFDP